MIFSGQTQDRSCRLWDDNRSCRVCLCMSHRLAHNVQPPLLLDASSKRVQIEKQSTNIKTQKI